MSNLTFDPGSVLASSAVNVDLDATFVLQLLFFAAFAVVMKDLIFDPLLRVFDAREQMSEGAIVEAREMDEQAIELKQEFDGKLEGVRREAAVDRERIRTNVKKVESELLGEARETMQERLGAGMAKLDVEVADIRGELETQRRTLAAEIATRVLGRDVAPEEARS
jgi:F-type H+-transporting ATPase subunit b